MAAVALPLISALAPSIIDLIAGLVHKSAAAAEAVNGPKTGPVKFAEVFEDVMTALQKAATAGQIAKDLPPDATVQLIIQSVVSSMKLAGLLDGATLPVPANPQAISLKSGQSITITGDA
jgi:hypothetical protein